MLKRVEISLSVNWRPERQNDNAEAIIGKRFVSLVQLHNGTEQSHVLNDA